MLRQGDNMLYKEGDSVLWKKYRGTVKYVFPANKTYIVTLYHYRGMLEVDRQIDQYELAEEKQLELI
jgi:hypothetical protein